MRKKVKRLFPIDYYGQDGRWQFAVRAEKPDEVLDAKYWQSEISCNRDKYDLLRIAVARFTYQVGYQGEDSYEDLRVKMMGPVVTVAKLNALYKK
ncbi:hypothetical protein [Thaumasiovibrio subtropicus]|uniref:hypothetical protein n=1 Tax=Thaumasiovibrio subtropicus TaxID=1891207 RepID=UPI000B350403|nr:hypothetical protein [Thaumasiovibrio subtropicus]